ncbi:hypothetical protein HPP92_008184 [Vanilla planifolia]|uniref:Uncharacterized protein n=1 Tax=Vanilla planifolia TaxID=51239 RepID=A0A835RBW9_VANPL|nr:hypothetical protein HPP92_008184 [Vanilla planifolia]
MQASCIMDLSYITSLCGYPDKASFWSSTQAGSSRNPNLCAALSTPALLLTTSRPSAVRRQLQKDPDRHPSSWYPPFWSGVGAAKAWLSWRGRAPDAWRMTAFQRINFWRGRVGVPQGRQRHRQRRRRYRVPRHCWAAERWQSKTGGRGVGDQYDRGFSAEMRHWWSSRHIVRLLGFVSSRIARSPTIWWDARCRIATGPLGPLLSPPRLLAAHHASRRRSNNILLDSISGYVRTSSGLASSCDSTASPSAYPPSPLFLFAPPQTKCTSGVIDLAEYALISGWEKATLPSFVVLQN